MRGLRVCWLFLVVGACVYTPPESTTGPDEPDPGAGSDPGDPPPTVERSCAVMGTSLCLEFEHDTQDLQLMSVALDGSGNDHDAVATNVTGTRRDLDPPVADDRAAAFGLDSHLEVGDVLAIDSSFTVEMWVQSDDDPAVTRSWLLDGGGRIFMSIGSDRRLRCAINDDTDSALRVTTTATIDTDWHHLACSFDGSRKRLRAYIDGSSSDCNNLDESLEPLTGVTTIGAHTSTSTAEHLVGALDSVRIHATALSGQTLCGLADRTSCTSQCQNNSDNDGGGFGGIGFGGGFHFGSH